MSRQIQPVVSCAQVTQRKLTCGPVHTSRLKSSFGARILMPKCPSTGVHTEQALRIWPQTSQSAAVQCLPQVDDLPLPSLLSAFTWRPESHFKPRKQVPTRFRESRSEWCFHSSSHWRMPHVALILPRVDGPNVRSGQVTQRRELSTMLWGNLVLQMVVFRLLVLHRLRGIMIPCCHGVSLAALAFFFT